MIWCLFKKHLLASAYLFREIFAITWPLSRILQGVNIDFIKALQLVDTAVSQLKKLRDNPQSILDAVELDFDGLEWNEKRIVRKKRMPGEASHDEPATSAKEKWERDVFYVSIDRLIAGINNRFSESRNVLQSFMA